MNRLLDSTLQQNDQVVLIMAVRKTISGVEVPPVGEILQTNILTMLS